MNKIILLLSLFTFISLSNNAQESEPQNPLKVSSALVRNKKLTVLMDSAFSKAGLELIQVGIRENVYKSRREIFLQFRSDLGLDYNLSFDFYNPEGKPYWTDFKKGVKQPESGNLITIMVDIRDQTIREGAMLYISPLTPLKTIPYEMWEWSDYGPMKWITLEPNSIESPLDLPLPVGDTTILQTAEVDSLPTFPGGIHGISSFISKKISYPPLALENGVRGKVYIEFVVTKEGNVANLKILRDIGGGCGQEAKRVVSLMKNWTPATLDGKPVAVKMVIPISFNLTD